MVTAKAKTKSKVGSKVAKGATSKTAKGNAKGNAKGKAVSKPAPKTVKKIAAKPVPKTAKKPASKPAPKPKTAQKPASKPVPKARTRIGTVSAARVPAKSVARKAAVPVSQAVVNLMAKPSTVKIGGGLSEAEVIKQSKTEYMSRQQLTFFKQRLLALQNELRENAGATTEHLRELAVAPDPADRATLEEEHALELRTRDSERKLLKKVQSALMRIEDRSYGYCEETGEPIGIQRLLARPTATLTIEAQERRELKQKMYGE